MKGQLRGITTIAVTVIGIALIAVAFAANQRWLDQHFLPSFFLTRSEYVRIEWIVRLGIGKTLISLHDKRPTGLVDHFAIAIENFDEGRVTRELKARGANPAKDIDAGFHIKDQSGIGVQIVGV